MAPPARQMTRVDARRWPRTPIAVGVILVVCLDGIPGLDLESYDQHGSFRYTDVCFIALIAIAVLRLLFARRVWPTGVVGRLYGWWAVFFTACWFLAVFHGAWFGSGLASAALFQRDYLYLAILGPLAPYLVTSPRELRVLMLTVATLVAIFCVVLIAGAVGVAPASLANPDHTIPQSGLTRIYTYMGDNNLIDLTFCVSLAIWVLGRGRSKPAGLLAGLCLIAMLVLLTRALYLSLLVSLAVVSLVSGASGAAAPAVRRKLVALGIGLVLVVITLVTFAPGALTSGPAGSVVSRATSGVSALGARSGTVAVRIDDERVMLAALDSKWAFGLGFRPPNSFYVPGLPQGNVEDIDVAGLDSVIAMGVTGTIVLLLPVLAAWGLALVRCRRRSPFQFLYLGLALWLGSVLVATPSLGAMDQTAGIATLSVGIGVLLRIFTWETVQPDWRPVVRRSVPTAGRVPRVDVAAS